MCRQNIHVHLHIYSENECILRTYFLPLIQINPRNKDTTKFLQALFLNELYQ